MKLIITILRVLLGLALLAFGINKIPDIGGFLPSPAFPERAQDVIGGLAVGYVLPWMVMTVEIVVGLMLVFGQWVPLALLLLAPLSVNIVLFHLTTAPETGLAAYVVAGLNLILLLLHFPAYRPVLQRKSN